MMLHKDVLSKNSLNWNYNYKDICKNYYATKYQIQFYGTSDL